jgi:hypothetical protein
MGHPVVAEQWWGRWYSCWFWLSKFLNESSSRQHFTVNKTLEIWHQNLILCQSWLDGTSKKRQPPIIISNSLRISIIDATLYWIRSWYSFNNQQLSRHLKIFAFGKHWFTKTDLSFFFFGALVPTVSITVSLCTGFLLGIIRVNAVGLIFWVNKILAFKDYLQYIEICIHKEQFCQSSSVTNFTLKNSEILVSAARLISLLLCIYCNSILTVRSSERIYPL